MKALKYCCSIILIVFIFNHINGQGLTLEEGGITLSTLSPVQFGSIYLNDGDIRLVAPGSPGSFFDVKDEGSFLFQNGSTLEAIELELTDAGVLKFNNGVGGSNLMTLDDVGVLGIGTGSPEPTVKLHLKSSGGTGAMRIENQHNIWDVYIDIVGDYVWKDFNGDGAFINVLDAYNYTTFSDKRLKSEIESIPSVLSGVLKLRPTNYFMGIKAKKQGVKSIGFIAQEVEKVFPDLVGEKNGYKTLAYSNFGVLAIKAIQEQQQIIEDQKSDYQKLCEKYSKLESRIIEIEGRMRISGKPLVQNIIEQ